MKDNDRRTAHNAPTCWQREAPCACLRIETAAREMLLLPYQHFVSATHTYREEGETLHLVFSTHDVEIAGRDLRALLFALQDFAVKWVRPLPARYHALAAESCVISDIRVAVCDESSTG